MGIIYTVDVDGTQLEYPDSLPTVLGKFLALFDSPVPF
jgi:hypothetical protein